MINLHKIKKILFTQKVMITLITQLQIVIKNMPLIIFIFHLAVLFAFIQSKPNLFLGAGGVGYGCGSNSPAVQRPFSYLRLGPDTTPLIKKLYFEPHHFGGYSDMDHGVSAFSHMHLVGAGVADLGILGILPVRQMKKVKIPISPSSILYKSTQHAQPGYYSVTIQNNITIELTSTQRCGIHRYKFPPKQKHQIYIMSSHLIKKNSPRQSITKKCGQGCIEGNIFVNGGFGGRFGGYHVYYHLEWIIKATSSENISLFNDTKIDPSINEVKGNYSGAIISTSSEEIQIYVGISYVSIENARQNLKQQVRGRKFDEIKWQSMKVWRDQLQRFEISAISPDYQTKIDTAIYRTLLSPTLFNDFNGQYPSFSLNGTIMTKPDYMDGVYTDMSLWDVHRTQFPWLLFQDERRFNDIANSILLINKEGEYMPKWPFANGHTGCMIGAHANTVLADWVLKSIVKDKTINKEEILDFMLRNANTQTKWDSRPDPTQYLTLGYISADKSSRSACSQTLELSYNDFSISQVAGLLNKQQIQKDFKNRSMFYKNVWNNKTKFFEPRNKDGSFVNISPIQRTNIFSNHYVEGDAWHYRFYAPHDPKGLIKLFGGEKLFVQQLNEFFARSFYWKTFWLPNPYYWAGNEHDLLSVWLFSFANRTDLTQKYSRKILETSYGINGAGLPGNDDYGTMSAWLVFASLGFYPVPSQNYYILGSPVVHSARIYRKMKDGKLLAFNINVQNNHINRHKVQSITLNGKSVQKFINFEDLANQNTLLNFNFML